MSIHITPLKEEHLEDAARLVSGRYRRLREQEPCLPGRYTEAASFLPRLRNILGASGAGAAALRGSRLVGFLTGWQMPAFRGERSTYSPEWANAAEPEDSRRIYEELYSRVAADWVAEKYVAHYISLFPGNVEALHAWHWLGFGMIAVDAIRGLDPLPGRDPGVHIRRAGPPDLEVVMDLHEALWQYSAQSPIFLLSEKKDRSYYEAWLKESDRVVWLACREDEPVAMMRLGPADEDVCAIIMDEKTTSIYAAFTREDARRGGIGRAVLGRALDAARAAGYERCAVSFEPMNWIGARFWLAHFRPVCLSLYRHVDSRLAQG